VALEPKRVAHLWIKGYIEPLGSKKTSEDSSFVFFTESVAYLERVHLAIFSTQIKTAEY